MIATQLTNFWVRAIYFVILGLVLASGNIIYKKNLRISNAYFEKTVTLYGYVDDILKQNKQCTTFNLVIKKINKESFINKRMIRLHTSEQQNIAIGNNLIITAKLKKPRNFYNYGSFDWEKICFDKDIVAVGRVIKINKNTSRKSHFLSIKRLRYKIIKSLKIKLEHLRHHGIIIALITGNTSYINKETIGYFHKTGTGHLIAISGLHIGLCWSICSQLFEFVFIRNKSKYKYVYLLSLICIWLYAITSGLKTSSLRACIMLNIYIITKYCKYNTKAINIFFLTLAINLVANPLLTIRSGFWLSYMAVMTILSYSQNIFFKKSRVVQYVNFNYTMFLFLLPSSIFYFGEISFISIIANSILIPYFSFIIMPLIIMLTIVYKFHILSGIISTLCDLFLNYACFFMEKASEHMPPITTPGVSNIKSILLFILILVFYIEKYNLKRLYLALIITLVIINKPYDKLKNGEYILSVLDVGQGLATVIRTKNHIIIYDTGIRLKNNDMGKQVVLPYLNYLGKNKINLIIISHADNDHIGGLKSILKNKETSLVISNDHNIPFTNLVCKDNIKWEWDAVKFSFLQPKTLYTNNLSKNNKSCVLRIENNNHSTLLTGDIEKIVETSLSNSYGEKLQSDVLLVPHHGSKTSSSEGFLKKVSPQIAVNSSGYKNKYKHPSHTVLKRYKKLGIQYLDTQKLGQIDIKITEKGISKLIRYNKDNYRYWYY